MALERTPGGDAVTLFVLDLFRLNNQLLSAGIGWSRRSD